MPRDAFLSNIQRESCHPKCARKVTRLSRNGPLLWKDDQFSHKQLAQLNCGVALAKWLTWPAKSDSWKAPLDKWLNLNLTRMLYNLHCYRSRPTWKSWVAQLLSQSSQEKRPNTWSLSRHGNEALLVESYRLNHLGRTRLQGKLLILLEKISKCNEKVNG